MLTHSSHPRLGERRFLARPTFVPAAAPDHVAWLRRALALLVAAAVVATLGLLARR